MMELFREWPLRLANSLLRIVSIVRKELLVTLADKGSRAILIVPVFLQALLFGYGATFNLERVPWVVYDESRSALSNELIRGLEGTGIFILTRDARSEADFVEAVDSGEALLGLRFPNDFKRTGEALLVADARNSTTAGIASGYVAQVVSRMNGAGAETLLERYLFNENGITRYAIVPAIVIVLALIQVLILSADSGLADHSPLTLRKINWSPYPAWVVRYFNFNDWTRYAVRSKNAYEVVESPVDSADRELGRR